MRKLVLIRHAQTTIDPNQPSSTWKLESSAQAACNALAQKLEPLKLNRIVTSEEFKARETGRLLAEALAIPCDTALNLHEHERTGVPYIAKPEDWLATLKQFFAKPKTLVFGTETAAEAALRFETAIWDVLSTYSDETLAIVSHATVMTLFIASHNPIKPFDFWQHLKMPDYKLLSASHFRLLES